MFFEVDCDIRKTVSGRFLELTGILDLVTDINKHSINICVVVPGRKWPPLPQFDESHPLV